MAADGMGSCCSMFILLFTLLMTVTVVTNQPTPIKKFIVDLGQPPEERWTHVVQQYPLLPEAIRVFILSVVPEYFLSTIDEIADEVTDLMPSPFGQEIKGISKALNMSAGAILLYNLAYELTAYCTSIVSQDVAGRIWHSRNLDYNFQGYLRNMTIQVDFQENGQTQYTVVTFVGYVGALTGQRPNVFTVSIDERDQGGWWKNLMVALFDRSVKWMGFHVRDVLAHASSFDSVIHNLANTDTIADVYYIVGGVKPGEGAVITKARMKADDVWFMNETSNKWFLVETNYDHWKAPPASDDRRDPAIQAMTVMGQGNISKEGLFKVMSTNLVLSGDTIYTTIMSAGQPELIQSWVRHDV